MTCLEFRRLCTVDAARPTAEYEQHRTDCAQCARFALRIARFEQVLDQALCVQASEGLSSRILLQQSIYQQQDRRQWLFRAMAMAASVLLVLGITWQFLYPRPSLAVPLPQIVLKHINDEPQSLLASGHDSSQEKVSGLLRQVGGDLVGQIGTIHYSTRCRIRHQDGIHLVLAGKFGPVTVLFMPGEVVDHRQEFQANGWTGVLLADSQGSIAIVGVPEEPLDIVEAQIRSNVRWL